MSPRLSTVKITLNSCSPKLLSLNLSSNKLFQLDSLIDVVKKAPQLKILNLSKNMVRRRDWGSG